jgi:hypothetical protein
MNTAWQLKVPRKIIFENNSVDKAGDIVSGDFDGKALKKKHRLSRHDRGNHRHSCPCGISTLRGMKESQYSRIKAQVKAIIGFFTEDKIITERYFEEEL